MKSLFSNVLLASLMVFAVACGKDGGKKNNGYSNYYNPYVGSGTVSGGTAFQNFTKYMDEVDSRSINLPALQIVKRVDSCKTKELFGIDALKYQVCTFSSPTGDQNETSFVNVQNGLKRSAYPQMQEILTAPAGYALINVVQQGRYFHVFHANVATNKLKIYTIDTNLSAQVNPYRVEDNDSGKIKTLLSPLY